MYLDYFGFHKKPFSLTPDPRFLYANPAYEEAYANLLYGIRERKGFIVLTGEVGTGKTTLLQKLMENLEETTQFVFFYNTTLTFEELLDFTCEELGLAVHSGGRLQKIQALNHFLIAQLEQGHTVALLIDEAQNLSEEALENLRLLSNLETAREKLLQIVLVGQPELEVKLAQPGLRQMKQRIATRCRLDRLKDREVGPFIHWRLRVAGSERQDLFTQAAIQRITVYAKGIPRLINLICDNALLVAYGTSCKTVSADIIEEVASDLRLKEDGRIVTSLTPPQEKTPSAHEQATPSPTVRSPILLPQTQRVATVSNSATETHIARSHQKHIVWAGLLALLLGGGGATLYSPHAKDRLASLWMRAKEVFGSAEARFASLTYDLNARLVDLMHKDTADDLTQPFLPTADASPGQKSETLPLSTVAAPETEVSQEDIAPAEDVLPLPAATDDAETSQSEPVDEQSDSLTSAPQDTTWQNLSVVIQPGATISGIVFATYGHYNTLVLDLIKEFNPHIADLDRVAAGETLWLPPLTRDTLLRKQGENTYRLITAAFRNRSRAEQFAREVRRKGYTVEISRREISSSLLLHRVEIIGLVSVEEVNRAWDMVNLSNVLSGVPVPTENSAATDNSPLRVGVAQSVEVGL